MRNETDRGQSRSGYLQARRQHFANECEQSNESRRHTPASEEHAPKGLRFDRFVASKSISRLAAGITTKATLHPLDKVVELFHR
jgi:hypothetical protein